MRIPSANPDTFNKGTPLSVYHASDQLKSIVQALEHRLIIRTKSSENT